MVTKLRAKPGGKLRTSLRTKVGANLGAVAHTIMRRVKEERGIALLATMLAIAMMTIIVIDFTSSSAMGYLSAANHANDIRAEYLARSGINMGLALIAQDTRTQMAAQQNNAQGLNGSGQVDSFASVWALPFPPMPVNGGRVQLSVVDEARKFNINKLINYVSGQQGMFGQPTPLGQSTPIGVATPVASPVPGQVNPGGTNIPGVGQPGQINQNAVMQLTRLVMLLGISPEIIPPIIDWLDPDSIETQGGAEADYYMRLMPPYEPRNGPMPTLGDLRLIRGIDDATFTKLRNYLTVQPETAININTAPPEVIACLSDSLANNPRTVEQIVDARNIRPFTNTNDVVNLLGGAAAQGTTQDSLTKDLTVRTTYFSITGMGWYAGARRLVFATFRRNGDGTGTLSSWQEE